MERFLNSRFNKFEKLLVICLFSLSSCAQMNREFLNKDILDKVVVDQAYNSKNTKYYSGLNDQEDSIMKFYRVRMPSSIYNNPIDPTAMYRYPNLCSIWIEGDMAASFFDNFDFTKVKELREVKFQGKVSQKCLNNVLNCPKLMRLEIDNLSQLDSIPSYIKDLKGLKVLKLGKVYPKTTFPEEMKALKLEELEISDFIADTLPVFIPHLVTLDTLSFKRAFPKDPSVIDFSLVGIGKLKGLKKLEIWSGRFYKFPDEIGELDSLEKFYLRNSDVDSLPESFARLTRLKEIYIFNSLIEYMPDLKGFTSLQRFEITKSPLSKIPNMSDSKELIYFDITISSLDSLPEWIGNLSSLKVFFIAHSKLNYVPESIGKLQNLKYLQLESSPIEKLPLSIAHLENLHCFSTYGSYHVGASLEAILEERTKKTYKGPMYLGIDISTKGGEKVKWYKEMFRAKSTCTMPWVTLKRKMASGEI